jgi:hypothetical protein
MNEASRRSPQDLQQDLLRYKVALQPNRHPQIWRRVADGFCRHSNASVLRMFETHDFNLVAVREFITGHKADFPYLCGPKIVNYWLYVLSSLTLNGPSQAALVSPLPLIATSSQPRCDLDSSTTRRHAARMCHTLWQRAGQNCWPILP